MKKLLLYLLFGLIFMLLQTTIFPRFFPPGLRPNLLLILVIYLGLSEPFLRATLLTLLFGALQDVFSATTLGLYVTVQLSILLLVRLFSDRLNIESRPLLLGLVGIGTIVQALLIGFLLATLAEAGPVLGVLLPELPLKIIANLFAGWVLLNFVLKLQPLLGSRRRGMAGLPYQGRRHET